MLYKVTVGISNRHVHLTKDVYDKLFDNPITKRNDLNQIGQFAANETVDLVSGDKFIEHVRIVGPLRNYNQVELLPSDASYFGINPPIRKSGDLDNSETITLRTEKASVTLENSCIIAQKHVHFNTNDVDKYNVEDDDLLKIHLNNEETFEAYAKVSDDGYYELHIDKDDANLYGINSGDEVFLEINK